MNIGTNIAELRKEKHWTQAQLAERVGVSEQAVSKWETCQTSPDVSLFPLLADLFGVSTDRLFGYERKSYEESVKQILKETSDAHDNAREIGILSDGLRRFPNSAKLKTGLAFALFIRGRITENREEKEASVSRVVRLCLDAEKTGVTPEEKQEALTVLSRIYAENGEYEKALEAALRIDADRYHLRAVNLANLRHQAGEGKREELRQTAEADLWRLWWASEMIQNILLNDAMEGGEYERARSFCRARRTNLSLYDEGNADFALCHKIENAERAAQIAKSLGQREECFAALKEFACLAERVPETAARLQDCTIGRWNPVFFRHTETGDPDLDLKEEYFDSVDPAPLYRSFDAFFGEDPAWKAFREAEASHGNGDA